MENVNGKGKKEVKVGVEGINVTFLHSERLRHAEKS